jgi:flagellin
MSSILTNSSAMSALQTLQSINKDLTSTQDRISSGLKIHSSKENAAYFSISETMKGDSGMLNAINDGLTFTKNSVATARLGAESFQELAKQFTDKIAFAQGAKGGYEEVHNDLDELLKQMEATITQSTFNGDDMVNAQDASTVAAGVVLAEDGTFRAEVEEETDNSGNVTVAGVDSGHIEPDTTTLSIVTGVSRASGSFEATTMEVDTIDLSAMLGDFKGIANDFANRAAGNPGGAGTANATQGENYLKGVLASSEGIFARATTAATTLGQAEKSIEGQQEFLSKLVDNIDAGVGSIVDANMEKEAARLQSLQVQQQLATQSLSIANQAPQNILSLFR